MAIALISGLYTVAGGLAAVVYTDAIETVVLIIGAAIIAGMANIKIGTWAAVTAVVPPEALSIIQPLDDAFMPWTGLLTGVPLLALTALVVILFW